MGELTERAAERDGSMIRARTERSPDRAPGSARGFALPMLGPTKTT